MIDEKKIYNYIKSQINKYGKSFKGTAYEFGLKIMDYIENMEKVGDWIPCSERLPNKSIVICDILYEEDYTSEKYHDIEILNYIGDGKFVNQWNDEKNVIAWQPLPERIRSREDD